MFVRTTGVRIVGIPVLADRHQLPTDLLRRLSFVEHPTNHTRIPLGLNASHDELGSHLYCLVGSALTLRWAGVDDLNERLAVETNTPEALDHPAVVTHWAIIHAANTEDKRAYREFLPPLARCDRT